MKKLLKGTLIVAATAAVAVGAALAYFSDVEVSTGNSLVAGKLDLQISNESYYYGPMKGVIDLWYRDDLSWMRGDLPGHMFFNYADLKPGDWGEDTIDVYIDNNPGWVCMDINLTATLENDLVDPEIEAGDILDDPVGELQNQVWFTFWADDGDNLFEIGEPVLYDGWLSMMDGVSIALADSTHNVWGMYDPETQMPMPVPGAEEVYIAKAWCYGNMLGWSPLEQGLFESVPDAWDEIGNTGVYCDGEDYSGVNAHNLSQTDSVTLDVSFYAEQWRHNDKFMCNPEVEGPAFVPTVATFR